MSARHLFSSHQLLKILHILTQSVDSKKHCLGIPSMYNSCKSFTNCSQEVYWLTEIAKVKITFLVQKIPIFIFWETLRKSSGRFCQCGSRGGEWRGGEVEGGLRLGIRAVLQVTGFLSKIWYIISAWIWGKRRAVLHRNID